MQISKIDSLNRYNDLLKSSIKSSEEFPNQLAEFLVSEYELQSVVIFKITEDNKLLVIGKSNESKKSYENGSVVECTHCVSLKSNGNEPVFNTQADCQIQASEFVVYEGSLFVQYSSTESAILKIAKRTPFSKTDKDNIETIGRAAASLLSIWSKSFSNSSIGKIITDIAHELRTPTNSIMGFASLLNEDNLSSSQNEYVITLKDNAYNLLALLNDLIDFSKLDAGISKENTSNINLKEFIEDIIKLFSEKIDKNIIDFLVSIDKKLPATVKIDSQKLRYALVNIITTSIRMTERGKISILVQQTDNMQLHIKISDTSPGISTTKLKDIFKPFALSDMNKNKVGSSTGLGLTLSKRYVELLKGQIEVSSSIGKGTTYNIYLNVETLSPIESQISSLPKPGNKNKVLVIEDDYATSKLLSNYLNKWGYDPTIVNSAEQALKAIDKEIYLAVLMDIILPDANGFELLKTIREHKNSKNTPVIVCSVEAEQQKAFLMGAVEYFVKPIKYKYLVEVLGSYKLKKDSVILAVDDDVPTLNLMKEAIVQAGYNCIAESKSAQVYNLIEDKNIDIAIIDLDMPELNGFDLIKQIKSNPKFAKLPVIIYTGKENYQDDLAKIDGLFSDLLHKSSTNIEDLADTINAMINSFDEPAKPEEVEKQKDSVKILLVEDYKHSQIIVTRLLKKNSFESIVVVENGQEALEQAKQHKYDLILMDMQMPVMNGFEATERIRQLPQYKETPIIALTAFAMKGDREKCLEAGATDYIPKPIDSQEFIEKVKFYTESKISVN